MPAPAVASWEGDPVIATTEDAVLAAEAREGYTRFTLTTARSPIDRVQWLVSGNDVTIGALEPREVDAGLIAEVSGARTVHRLTATGQGLCVTATFSYQGSNRPLALGACEAEFVSTTTNEENSGRLKAPGDYSLRGNPEFSEAALSPQARMWYEKIWIAIEHPTHFSWATELAASDNLYHYSRPLHTHIQTLLTVFRFTGDLTLLDEVDRLAELMRAQLEDSWRGAKGQLSGGRDGYLNWVWRLDSSLQRYYGRDTNELDEARTHAILAQIAWVYQSNRDLTSPVGIDYGERADFWIYYLQHHYEAKWRKRHNLPSDELPFILIDSPHVHSAISKVKYYYYMHKLTGHADYLREAQELTHAFLNEVRTVDTSQGQALVWRRHIDGGRVDYLMPSTYARYVMADTVDLHFEEFGRWSEEGLVMGFANTLAQLMLDNGAIDLARDVGGGVKRAGYAPSSANSWSRMRASVYAVSPFALLAPWDLSGKVAKISQEMLEDVVNSGYRYHHIYIPAGMFLYEMLR
jgi:hypothetical protein